MILKVHDTVVVIVLHWTYGQSQDVVESLLKYVPEVNILAVDNNPSISDIKDNPQRWKSYMTWGLDWKRKDYRISETWVRHFCDGESYWFNNHSQITCIRPPEFMPHGASVDFALEWCLSNNIRKVIHIEPDCIISGRKWYDQLINTYRTGDWWMISGDYTWDGLLHPTPSICNVQKAHEISWNLLNLTEQSARNIFDIPHIEDHVNLEAVRHHGYWDTGHLFALHCALHNKCKKIEHEDFVHIGWGRNRISPKAISFV